MRNDVWKVVVIDDSPEDRAEVRRLLLTGSDRRYKFIEAETGAAGVRETLAASPDCVVLDYNLPDTNALGVLAELADPRGATVCPVVVLTGSARSDLGRAVMQAGAQDFIGKSWMVAQSLTRAIENAVERWAMAKELHARTAAVAASEERLRLAVEVSGLGAIGIDYTTDTATPDPIAAALFGLEAGVSVSRSELHARFHPDDAAEIMRLMNQSIDPSGDGWFVMEHRVVHRDGSLRWLNVKKHVLFGEVAGVRRAVTSVLAAVDITDQKLAEDTIARQFRELGALAADLSEADRRKDEFLATLAHELRNPLAPIRSGLEVMKLSGVDAPIVAKTREMMDRQLGHMVRLIDELLDVSRINTGKVVLERERLEIRTIVDLAMEASQPLVEAGGHTLTVKVPDEQACVDGDLTRLAQVVTNLVNNAAKYTARHGAIALSVRVEHGQVVLSVADTGAGISADMLHKVFDMFTQVDRTVGRAQGGLGIGLSLVKTLVEMHGGRVVAESPGLGLGSTFTVRLPLATPEQREDARGSTNRRIDPPVKRRRLLVVDDNADGAEMLATMLELLGHDAEIAFDGPAALQAIREHRPDLVFLDIGLPGMSGYEVAERLRSDPATSGGILVALTGWGTDDDKRKSQEAGFDAHLTKPVGRAAIKDVLDRLLGGAESRACAPDQRTHDRLSED